MVEQVTIQEQETTAEKPVEENVSQSRPDGLPEKFKSVEDLAKSYTELEKKLGTQEKSVDEKPAETKNDLEIAEKAVETAGLDMDVLAKEYADNGALDEKSYQALEKAGISKQYVDQFIAGQNALAEQQGNEVKSIAGGDESYNEMVNWASNNFNEAEKTAYNNAVNSKDMEVIKLAVTGLKARYEQANGKEPSLVQGKATSTAEPSFQSWAQVTQAMADPRYAKDPAYQAEVKNKLANSNL
jgi:cobalamin biosynthesis protein CobT